MYLKRAPKQLQMQQRGSVLTMAVFMIVVFSLLGVVMLKMITTSSENVSYEVLGLRAFTAADSGLQWGLQQLFPMSGPAIECGKVDFNHVPILQAEGLAQCQIESLQCTDFVEAGTRYYTLTSTGTCTGAEVSTSRTLQIDARSL